MAPWCSPTLPSHSIPWPPHLQYRSVPGRVTSSTKRPPGTRDELMYQNTSKTSSAQRRLRAAYAARIRWAAQGRAGQAKGIAWLRLCRVGNRSSRQSRNIRQAWFGITTGLFKAPCHVAQDPSNPTSSSQRASLFEADPGIDLGPGTVPALPNCTWRKSDEPLLMKLADSCEGSGQTTKRAKIVVASARRWDSRLSQAEPVVSRPADYKHRSKKSAPVITLRRSMANSMS